MAMAFAREGDGARRAVVHRRRRIVARRMARSDQPLRRAPAAGDLLRRRTTRPRCRRRSREQSAVRVFADKAAGYGIPGITIDGTDPDAIAAAFAWAAERARDGQGPALIELVCMRMCGHAHHDDMLYLGSDPQPSWTIRALTEQGYADPRAVRRTGRARDPMATYAARLEAEGVIAAGRPRAHPARGRGARRARGARGHRRAVAGRGGRRRGRVRRRAAARARRGARSGRARRDRLRPGAAAARAERAASIAKGSTFLDAVMLGVGDALRADPRVFVFGEDVGGKYGNAFLLLRPLLKEFGDRILNSPLAEGAVHRRRASARRSPGSGRSARCSSTTSSRPASISS